jgi:hypothetical protein
MSNTFPRMGSPIPEHGYFELDLHMRGAEDLSLQPRTSPDPIWDSPAVRESSILRLRLTQVQQELERSSIALTQKIAECTNLTALLERVAVEKGQAMDERDELQHKIDKASQKIVSLAAAFTRECSAV